MIAEGDGNMHVEFKKYLEIEQQTELKSYEEFGKWFLLIGESIEALIELLYLKYEVPLEEESDEYFFYLFVKESYMHAPFSFRSVSILMSKGQYQEAMNLCRSIIENFVNCRYLFLYKNKAKKALIGEDFKIKTSWEAIAGNYAYSKIYKFLCKTEHKNFGHGNSQPRFTAYSLQSDQFYPVPVFDKKQAGAIINYFNFLIYGYLSFFSTFFNYKFDKDDSGIEDIIKRLNTLLIEHKKKFPEAQEWCDIMEKIVGI